MPPARTPIDVPRAAPGATPKKRTSPLPRRHAPEKLNRRQIRPRRRRVARRRRPDRLRRSSRLEIVIAQTHGGRGTAAWRRHRTRSRQPHSVCGKVFIFRRTRLPRDASISLGVREGILRNARIECPPRSSRRKRHRKGRSVGSHEKPKPPLASCSPFVAHLSEAGFKVVHPTAKERRQVPTTSAPRGGWKSRFRAAWRV